MAEKDTRAPGAIKKAQQRAAKKAAETESRVAAIKARAGRATTDAEGALQQGVAEASARVQARKDAPKKERKFGPIETRARERAIRLLGYVPNAGPNVRGSFNPEDIHSDLPGKAFTVRKGSSRARPMTGDEIAGTITAMATHAVIEDMMRSGDPIYHRDFNPGVSGSGQGVDASKISRHENLARQKSVAPVTRARGRVLRHFSKVNQRTMMHTLPAGRYSLEGAFMGTNTNIVQPESKPMTGITAISDIRAPQEVRASQEAALTKQYGPETVPWQKTMSAMSPSPRQARGPINTTPTDWGVGGSVLPNLNESSQAFASRYEGMLSQGQKPSVRDTYRYKSYLESKAKSEKALGKSGS